MFKRGICAIDDLRSLDRSGSVKNISYSLLKHDDVGPGSSVQSFELIIRDLAMSSGVHRTTYRGRLQDVDAIVRPYLLEFFGRSDRIAVHDWAASDGLVASEWAQDIFKILPFCCFTASDLTLYLVEVRRGNRETYIFEPTGMPLQYVRRPFVISFNRRDSIVFFANRLLRARAERHVKSIRSMVSQFVWTGFDDPTEYCVGQMRFRVLPLVHPEARALQSQTPNFRIVPHSVLSPLEEPVEVIRSMNIYHQRYFDDGDIAKGAKAVFDSVVLGGLWILGRTTEEKKPVRNEASIFRKTESGFQVLHRLNGGSELEGLLQHWGFIGAKTF